MLGFDLDDVAVRVLWRGVLSRAIADSLALDLRLGGNGAGRETCVSAARAWLLAGVTRDAVIEAAGLSVEMVEDHLPGLRRLWRLIDQGGELPDELRPARSRAFVRRPLAVAA